MSNKNKKLNLDKETLYDLYVNQQMTSEEIAKVFNCTSKSIRNYLINYGIPVRQNGEAVKLQRSKWSTEKEQARSKKFIQNWHDKSDEEKAEITAKRTKNINSHEAIIKAKETKLKNNTVKKSIAEEEFYNKLILFFDQDDIIRQYIDLQKYPFNCDFYIKSKDLFIEYQGHQTHGTKPYDELDPDCWDEIEEMEKRGYSSTTYTVRDPKKIKTAIDNNLKLLLIYPKNNSYLIKNGTIKNLGHIDIIDINDID